MRFLAVLLCLLPSAALALTEAEAIRLATERSPRLHVLASQQSAARERQQQAERFFAENPVLKGATGPRREEEVTSVDLVLGLEQPLELWGQKGHRLEAGVADLAALEAEVRAARAEVAAEVRKAFAAVLADRERATMVRETLRLADSLVGLEVEREKQGSSTRLAVNELRIARGAALRELAAAEGELRGSLSALRLLLRVEEVEVEGSLLETAAPVDVEVFLERARRERADLAAAAARVRQAEALSGLARTEALPELAVGVDYVHERTADVLLGVLSIELPFFERNAIERSETATALAEARQERLLLDRRIGEEVRVAAARLESAREVVRALGDEVMPAARENADLVEAGREAGKIGLVEELLIRRQIVEAQLSWVDALEELAIARAELLQAVGAVD